MKRLPATLALFSLLACGAEPEAPGLAPVTLSFALPIDCAAPPNDLEAVAWVSGSREATPLVVDLDARTTSGTLRVTTGAERRIVIDWFVERGARVLLAQAVASLDLTAPEEDRVSLAIAPADVEVARCVDVTDDVSRVGSPTTTFDGQARPPCDLDASCGGDLRADCSNLGELCAGGDPLAEP